MPRLLVVDDKTENLYYLKALFGPLGYEVEEARHGAEALVRARNVLPDLVISDLLMPVMDGYTLLRHWKADARLASIPFVVYTATYTEPEDERLALALGADDFILKPCEPEDLVARIRAIEAAQREGAPLPRARTPHDEPDLLKVYSQTLVRKLEEKSLQLEHTNQALESEIGERRRLAETLAAILDALPAQIALVDATGVIRAVNATWKEQGGGHVLQSAEYSIGHGYLEICDNAATTGQEDARAAAAGIRAVIAGSSERYVAEYECHDGSNRRWFQVIATPLRTSGQAGAVVMHLDITERKAIEAQFLRAQRMESIGTLAGGIAHDLNNVLTPILMSIDLLRASDDDAVHAETLALIESSARKGSDMVRQVLSFARGVDGRRIEVNLRELIREVEHIGNDTFLKTVRLEDDIPDTLPPVLGDPTQLHQVLLNLSVNARDAMPQGGTITFSASLESRTAEQLRQHPGVAPGQFVRLQVRDSGTGIPTELLDRIFEPFFTTKETGKGTGLGLSTSLAIIKSHGGFFQVESVLGRGTTFEIFLPVAGGGRSVTPVAATSPVAKGNGRGVLVVDDEAIIRELTRRTLESRGFRVLLAADGSEAIAMFLQHQQEISLVITDMMMPVMDGAATIRALRGIDPEIPIIAVSGLTEAGTAERSIAAPGRPVQRLNKPYTMSELLETLASVLP